MFFNDTTSFNTPRHYEITIHRSISYPKQLLISRHVRHFHVNLHRVKTSVSSFKMVFSKELQTLSCIASQIIFN